MRKMMTTKKRAEGGLDTTSVKRFFATQQNRRDLMMDAVGYAANTVFRWLTRTPAWINSWLSIRPSTMHNP